MFRFEVKRNMIIKDVIKEEFLLVDDVNEREVKLASKPSIPMWQVQHLLEHREFVVVQ
jgi:hypothetical protein